jgi:hypothetical protein
VDILIAYMKGLDKLVFNAPINSSILNAWTPTPLKLAGLLTDGVPSLPPVFTHS